MDTNKLLNLLVNLSLDEETNEIGRHIGELMGYINNNDTENTEVARQTLNEKFTESSLNSLPYSDFILFSKIGASKFFGRTAQEYLDGIFSKDAHLLKTNIQKFSVSRTEFLKNIANIADSLHELGFTEHYDEEEFELGITLPDTYKDLSGLQRAVKDWGQFLSYIAEVRGEEKAIKISYVSEGSIAIFVLISKAMARTINLFMAELATYFEAIERIQKARAGVQFLKNDLIQKELETEITRHRENFIRKVTEQILTDLGAKEKGGTQESDLGGRVKKILTLTENGVKLELIPPEPQSKETDTETEETNKKEDKKVREQINTTQNLNKRLTPLYLNLVEEPTLISDNDETKEE